MRTLNPAYARIHNDKIGCQADDLMALRAELWAVCVKCAAEMAKAKERAAAKAAKAAE